MARKNAIVSVEQVNGGLSFTVADIGSFTINPDELSDEIVRQAILHGLTQKISDAAAGVKEPSDKFAEMKAVAERLSSEDASWNKRTGDGSGPVAGLIFRAYAEFMQSECKRRKQPIPTDEMLRTLYDKKERKAQLALRNVPEIAAIMDRLRAEKGSSASVDTDSLFDELGDL